MEQKKEETEHSHLIYSEMLKERKTNLLTQSSSYRAMTEELALKKEKADRWQVANTKKKQTILKLEQILMKEEQIEIPAGLAQELSSKL